MARVETGPLQVGDGWPGLFIRGDNAAGYALSLTVVLSGIDHGYRPNPIDLANVRGLLRLLQDTNVKARESQEAPK